MATIHVHEILGFSQVLATIKAVPEDFRLEPKTVRRIVTDCDVEPDLTGEEWLRDALLALLERL